MCKLSLGLKSEARSRSSASVVAPILTEEKMAFKIYLALSVVKLNIASDAGSVFFFFIFLFFTVENEIKKIPHSSLFRSLGDCFAPSRLLF